MTDIVLDAATRALTVDELPERTRGGPVRLVSPDGIPLGELNAANPFPGGFQLGRPPGATRAGDPRDGAVSGDEFRARLRALRSPEGLGGDQV